MLEFERLAQMCLEKAETLMAARHAHQLQQGFELQWTDYDIRTEYQDYLDSMRQVIESVVADVLAERDKRFAEGLRINATPGG